MADQDGSEQPAPTSADDNLGWIAQHAHDFKRRRQQRRTDKAHETAIDRSTRGTKWASWVIAVATIVMAGAVISQYVIFDKQLTVMQGQLDVMGADQRPWVSIERLNISSALAYDDAGWQNGKRWHITLTYTLKNYGKTPATHVIFWAHIVPIVMHYQSSNGAFHGTFIGDELNAACAFPEGTTALGIDSGQLMFPGDEWSPKSFEVQGDEKVFAEAKVGKAQYSGAFLIPVCVTYRSAYAQVTGVAAIIAGRPFDDAKPTIFGNDKYRTVEGYRLGKQSGAAINLDGEVIGESDLVLGEPGFQATSVK